jgi:hypothetical protein
MTNSPVLEAALLAERGVKVLRRLTEVKLSLADASYLADWVTDARTVLRALSARPAEVVVRKLEWELEERNWWVAAPDAFHRRLGYEVRQTDSGNVRVRTCNEPFRDFDGTVEEAKAAAQADYERRILSSLEASPAPVSEEMRAALELFERHYPMGINPYLDEACRKARAALAAKGGQ